MESELVAAVRALSSRRPFTNGDLRRLGDAYKAGWEPDIETRVQIETWYEKLGRAATVVVDKAIERVLGVDGAKIAIKGTAQRLKTIETLVQKLNRGTYDLSRMQDYMGVRFDLDCYHAELIEIGEQVAEILETAKVNVKIDNILESPHNGYRAVHLRITSSEAGRVEVQLRTLLQTAWANAYEKAGDIAGRSIRYDDDFVIQDPNLNYVVNKLLEMSDMIYRTEVTTERTANTNQGTFKVLSEGLEPRFEALPRNSKYYEGFSRAFHALGDMFASQAELAMADSDLLDSLQTLEDSLRSWRAEEQRK